MSWSTIAHKLSLMSSEGLCKNLRTSRRGAVAGPSGMTAEHLCVLLHCPMASTAFVAVAIALSRADVPQVILDAIRLGRLTALRKPSGVRGIVAGDIVRRLVAAPCLSNSQRERKKPQRRSNTLCRQGRAQSASPTCSKPSQIWMIGPQWSLWMALVRSV